MSAKYKVGNIIYVPVKVDKILELGDGTVLYEPNQTHADRAGLYIPENIINEVDGKLFIDKDLLGERFWRQWGYVES